MFKSLSDRRVSQAALLPLLPILMLPILMLSGVLAGCAPGSWPQLSSVERPAGAADPAPLAAAGEDELTAVAADSAAPPSGQALEEPGAAGEELDSFRQSVALAEETAERTWGAYVAALDRLLASGGDEEELVSRWSTAQSALSRFSMAVDMLRDLRDEAARRALQFSSAETGRSERALLVPTGELVSALSTATERRQEQMARENNRLAVLTPPSFGTPGPAEIADGGRTAFAVIDFSGSNPQYADRLAEAVREVQSLVPDVALDIIALGPEDAEVRQQTALRQVLRDLRRAGISPEATAVALGPAADRTEIRIYLRRLSR